MTEPTAELLPGGAELVPGLVRQVEAVEFVAVEHVVELLGNFRIKDDSVVLIVEAHTAGVEIGRAHGAETSVDHQNL